MLIWNKKFGVLCLNIKLLTEKNSAPLCHQKALSFQQGHYVWINSILHPTHNNIKLDLVQR